MARSVQELLSEVRDRYERVQAEHASEEQRQGAIIVDTRCKEQREEHGLVPGAVLMERNVMEWRLDPVSDVRMSFVDGNQTRIIVMCQQGFGSSIAVGSLLDLGLERATDLIGGFEAWRDAGLPVLPHSAEADERARRGPGPTG